jgi:LmbE family N-acetylglucosaminyl deacetylase
MTVVASLHLAADPVTSDSAELPFARTLVIAPHPDDESIGVGGLLAHAAQRGATVRVVFLTDGDNNPWPRRLSRRRWRITDDDRREWGKTRRREARHALMALGVPPHSAVFLGFPDDGLAAVEPRSLIESIGNVLLHFHPTLLVVPSVDDYHPDHRAACRATLRALGTIKANDLPMTLSYVVHGRLRAGDRQRIPISAEERARKRDAIGNHATQLLLSRNRFLRYGARDEQYGVVSEYTVPDETLLVTCLTKVKHVLSVLW